MHEFSLCRSIAAIVSRHAAGRPVRRVHLRVGALRQVVPDTLVHCWGLVSEQTPLCGARLVVQTVPVALCCAGCGRTAPPPAGVGLCCAGCGGTGVRVVAGEEFLVTSLELAEE